MVVPGSDSLFQVGSEFWFQLVWKGTAVLLAAWGCARLLRRSSAAARHLTWAAALVALLAITLLVSVGPVWRLDVLPAVSPEPKFRPAAEFAVREDTVPSYAGRDLSPAVVVAAPPDAQWQWSVVASIVWAAGALVGLLRLAAGLAWTASIRRRARMSDAPATGWAHDVEDASAILGLARRVPVYLSDRVGVPVTCGILRPTLLLPAEAGAWPGSRRRAVVLHELAHVARRDCLTQAIGHAACSLHWFNPLAFLALRRLRREQELACDDAVLGVGVSAVEYARHLCDVAGTMRSMSSPEWATLAMARPSNLEARVTSILDDRVRRQSPRRASLAAAALIVAGVLPFSALRLSAVTPPLLPGIARFVSHQVLVPHVPDVAATSALAPDPSALSAESTEAAALAPAPDAVPDLPVDEFGPIADFSGTWILDEARSGSPAALQADPSRAPQWGDVVVIRQADMWLRIESRRGDQKATASYPMDEREYRFVDERSPVGGGIALRGSDVKTVWDGGKLVTLTRPFSLWVPDEHDMADAPNRSSMEFLSIRSLSTDGQEMIVERVSRHDWGWGFDGRQPSAAYARVTDVYRRATP